MRTEMERRMRQRGPYVNHDLIKTRAGIIRPRLIPDRDSSDPGVAYQLLLEDIHGMLKICADHEGAVIVGCMIKPLCRLAQ